MRVLLHIGSPKAGSSSLQLALIRNEAALRAHGVLPWRADASKGPPPLTLANRFKPDDRPLRPRERLHFANRGEARAWSEHNWMRLHADVVRERPELTVLSSEFLFDMGGVAPVLAALSETFEEIHILAYIRDPVDHYRSMLDQRIRDGDRFRDLPLPTGFGARSHTVLQRYQRRLGRDRVILRSFDRRAFVDGDLVADFAAQIGRVLGRPVPMPEAVQPANESLCAAATLWLMAANEAFIRFAEGDDSAQIQRRMALVERLQAAPALQALPKMAAPPQEIADWVRAHHNEAIRFFNDAQPDPAHHMPTAPEGLKIPDDETMRTALRRWLLGQADPALLATVLDAAVG